MSTVASPRSSEVSLRANQTPNPWTSRPAKTFRRVGAAIVVVILLRFFAASTYFNHETYVNSYNVWNVFHYYLGAKYFPEVGYFNLYTCALEADQESSGYWEGIIGVRDMQTYRVVPRFSLPPCPRTNFTADRWNEFSRDVESFAMLARPGYFAGLFVDKGLNPPPSWVAVAKPLAQTIPISTNQMAAIVFNLDVVAVLIGVLIIWGSRGGIAALLTAVLVVFYFGNFGCIGGNFLQYFWFPLAIGAIVLWSKNRPVLSGAALGAAVGLQMFPLFFALPIAVRGIVEFLRKSKKTEWLPHFRFTGALVAVMLASFLLGSMTGRGVGAWGEWQRKISIHKQYLRGEIFDIGLANLTATAVSSDHDDGKNYVVETRNTFLRLDAFKRNIQTYYALSIIFLAMWLLVVACAPAGDLFGYGFLLMYTAVTASPYYYLTLALVPFIFWKSGRAVRLYATGGTVALFVGHAILFRGSSVSLLYWPHLWSECSIALFLLGLAAVSIFSLNSSQSHAPEMYGTASGVLSNE